MNVIDSGDMRGKLVITNPKMGVIHTLNWSQAVRKNIDKISTQYHRIDNKTIEKVVPIYNRVKYIASTLNTVIEHHRNHYALAYATGDHDAEYFDQEQVGLESAGIVTNSLLSILEVKLKALKWDNI